MSTPFKDLEANWSYLASCESVGCHNCGHDMLEHTEKLKDDDDVDFGDMASCPICGCITFDGVFSK